MSPPDCVVSKEWNIHKEYIYTASWQYKSSFPWESESYMTSSFDCKKHVCKSLTHKTVDTCIAVILLHAKWKGNIWEHRMRLYWVIEQEKASCNLSDAGSVILTWNKNASLNSFVVLTVTKLTHISHLIASELTEFAGKESQTKAAETAHIPVLCL